MVRKVFLALGLTAMTLSVAACNTIDGAQEDVESVANEVEEEI